MSYQAVKWSTQHVPPGLVSLAARAVLDVYAEVADEHGRKSYQSHLTIAWRLGCTERNVTDHIKALVDAGLLVRSADQSPAQNLPADNRPVVYELPLHWVRTDTIEQARTEKRQRLEKRRAQRRQKADEIVNSPAVVGSEESRDHGPKNPSPTVRSITHPRSEESRDHGPKNPSPTVRSITHPRSEESRDHGPKNPSDKPSMNPPINTPINAAALVTHQGTVPMRAAAPKDVARIDDLRDRYARGWELVRSVVPDSFPESDRTTLAGHAGRLIDDGKPPALVLAMLTCWVNKQGAGPNLLPHLESDAARELARAGTAEGSTARLPASERKRIEQDAIFARLRAEAASREAGYPTPLPALGARRETAGERKSRELAAAAEQAKAQLRQQPALQPPLVQIIDADPWSTSA